MNPLSWVRPWSRTPSWRPAGVISIGTALLGLSGPAMSSPLACSARSGPGVTPVVELYTSEGCSSCPPADRWLSALKGRGDVVALAFHVDYWDRLGWKDRFASPAFTRRQLEQLPVNGARFAYTPQVVVDGRDRKDWPRLAVPGAAVESPVSIELSRDGDRVTAKVTAGAKAPARLAAYWAVTESNHRTVVRAGENDGATLTHDFVVREWVPVPAWTPASQRALNLSHPLRSAGDAAPARRVNLVVIDADGGRPLQALGVDC